MFVLSQSIELRVDEIKGKISWNDIYQGILSLFVIKTNRETRRGIVVNYYYEELEVENRNDPQGHSVSRYRDGRQVGTHPCNRCKEREILTGRSRDVSSLVLHPFPQVCPSVSLSGCHHQFCTLASVKTLTLLLLRWLAARYKFRWTIEAERKIRPYLFE